VEIANERKDFLRRSLDSRAPLDTESRGPGAHSNEKSQHDQKHDRDDSGHEQHHWFCTFPVHIAHNATAAIVYTP
jgi:hypothetical protein